MNSSKFFEDNRKRIDARDQPVEHNMNEGLLALSHEIAQLRSQLAQANELLAKLLHESRLR